MQLGVSTTITDEDGDFRPAIRFMDNSVIIHCTSYDNEDEAEKDAKEQLAKMEEMFVKMYCDRWEDWEPPKA
jgi:hypothetical protein